MTFLFSYSRRTYLRNLPNAESTVLGDEFEHPDQLQSESVPSASSPHVFLLAVDGFAYVRHQLFHQVPVEAQTNNTTPLKVKFWSKSRLKVMIYVSCLVRGGIVLETFSINYVLLIALRSQKSLFSSVTSKPVFSLLINFERFRNRRPTKTSYLWMKSWSEKILLSVIRSSLIWKSVTSKFKNKIHK